MSVASTVLPYSFCIPPPGQEAMSLNTVNMFNVSTLLNQKDSRWLQLEVCRESQRQKCSRSDAECKFAHPPSNVEVQNGRVTACYDSIKGRCNREKPACKYFHPPQHLKDQLLINGRNHLALKNALAQQMQQQFIPNPNQMIQQAVLGGHFAVPSVPPTYFPYLSQLPLLVGSHDQGQTLQFSARGPCHPTVNAVQQQPPSAEQHHAVQTSGVHLPPQKPHSDKIEALPGNGVMPYKRAAIDKRGLPVYQPQQTMGDPTGQLQTTGPGQLTTTQAYPQFVQMQPPSNIVPVTYSGQPSLALPRYQ